MTDHITIGDVSPRIQYVADGVQTDFTYPFPIFADTDLEAFVDAERKTLATDYAVAGAGASAGGSVTFTVAPAAGTTVTLQRDIAVKRTSDFQESGEFRAKVINDELDYQTAAIQEVKAAVERSLRLAVHDTGAALELPLLDDRRSKALHFSATGDAIAVTPGDQSGTAVTALGSATSRLLAERANDGGINVLDHGGVGNGSADDRDAILDAIDAAPADALTRIYSPPGKHFMLASALGQITKPIIFDFTGSILEGTSDARLLDLFGGFETPQSATVAGKVVTVADGSAFAVGKVVKVYADDRLDGSRPDAGGGLGFRVGEYAVVVSISGNDLTVAWTVGLTYATNVKVAKLKDTRFAILGGEFRAEAGNEGSWTSPLIAVAASRDLYVAPGVKIGKAYNPGLKLVGVFGYRVDGLIVDGPVDDAGNNHFGHGISDEACFGGRVDAMTARICRHGFTTNANETQVTASATDIEAFGPSAGFVVSRSLAIGPGDTGFDTHHGARNGKFVDCFSHGRPFGVRGWGISLDRCRAIGASRFFIYSEDAVAEADRTDDIVLRDCVADVDGTYAGAIRYQKIKTLTIDGGSFETDKFTALSGDTGTELRLEGTRRWVLGSDATELSGWALTSPTKIVAHGSDLIDCSTSVPGTSEASRVIAIAGAGTIDADFLGSIRVEPSASVDKLFHRGGSPSVTLDIEQLNWSGTDIGSGDVFSNMTSQTVRARYARDDKAVVSNYKVQTIDSAFENISLGWSGDAVVTVALACDGSYTLGKIAQDGSATTMGAFPGQICNLVNTNSTHTLTVAHGETANLPGDADVALTPGDGIGLYWSGSAWNGIATGLTP